MLSRLARFFLVATSLSPVLGAVAINQWALGRDPLHWIAWPLVAVLLVLLCWLLLHYAARNAQLHEIKIAEYEGNDKEVVAFLLAYLLPFLTSKNLAFEGDWITGAYVLGVLFVVVSHSGVYHFNPVMGFLGYHIYTTKDSQGIPRVLITKSPLRRRDERRTTVKLSDEIYLDT